MSSDLNAGLNIMDNYAADVAVTMVFGIGYYLFKGLKNKAESWSDPKENLKNLKGKLAGAFEKWQYAKTIEDYNELIKSDYEGVNDPFSIINMMNKKGILPTIDTYNALLMNCLLTDNEHTNTLRDEILDPTGPVTPNVYTLTVLLKGHNLKYKNLIKNESERKKILQERFDKELLEIIHNLENTNVYMDVVSQNTILDALIDQERFEEAWNHYVNMKKFYKPDVYTYSTLLRGFKSMNELCGDWLAKVFEVLDEAKSANEIDSQFLNTLLDSCVKFNRVDKAEELFYEMKDMITITDQVYSTMIKAYAKVYKMGKADEMFKKIDKPDVSHYAIYINACIRCKNLDKAERLLDEMAENGIEKNMTIYTIMLNGYRNGKNYDKALRLYESIKHLDVGTSFTNNILDCCLESHRFELLEQIFAEISKNLNNLDDSTYSIYMRGLAKAKKYNKVTEEYERLKAQKDLKLDEAIYNIVLDCFTKNGEDDKLISVYNDMKQKEIKMSLLTYGVFIKIYCNKGDCVKAFELFDECVKNDIKPSVVIYHMLIKLQIKSNYIANAITMFKNMTVNKIRPDSLIYENIIKACLENGFEKNASEFILQALTDEIKLETYLFEMLADCFTYNQYNDLNRCDKSDICDRILKLVRERGIQVDKKLYNMLSGFILKNEYVVPQAKYNKSNNSNKMRHSAGNSVKEISIYDAAVDVVKKSYVERTGSLNNNSNAPNSKKFRNSNKPQQQFYIQQSSHYSEEKSIYS